MKEVTKEQFERFCAEYKEVIISDNIIPLGAPKKIKCYQPEEFQLERTNAWSFPKRGIWATHKGDFRGNWPPQLVRNVILRYSNSGETVLDQMCGSGTTLIECKLLGRNGIGVDVNENAIMVSRDRLSFDYDGVDTVFPKTSVKTYVGDAKNLDLLKDDSIDLIATHPPYANIISYSNKKNRVVEDLSFARSLTGYLDGMKEVAKESFRVLKPGRFCAVLVGDTRKSRHHVPIAFRVMDAFLEANFVLREDIIKAQWKTKTTREKWAGLTKFANERWVGIDEQSKNRYFTDFYLLSYEHLFIFRKAKPGEDTKHLKGSMKPQIR